MSFTDWTEGNLVKVPAFDLTVGGVQLLSVNDRLMSLTLTDNRGFEADTLELTIDDTDGKIALPARGAEISVSLDWKGEALVHKGIYTVDEISHSGPPDQITITARSTDFRQDFNVKREYSWHDIKVPDVVSAIAGRYNLKPAVSKQLMHIEIDHADQTNESDISFLTRMAEMLGAIATIKNGSLLFIVPNQGVIQSGKAYTGVQAYWLDLNYGKQKKINLKRKQKPKKEKSSKKEGDYIEGAEGNVFVMRQTFKNEQSAKRATAAKWSKLQRGVAEFNITLAEGRTDLYPEMPVTVTGFKPTINSHQWVISRVTHTIDGNGFITHLELEIKIKDIDMTDDEQNET